jgi:hypothetical protein
MRITRSRNTIEAAAPSNRLADGSKEVLTVWWPYQDGGVAWLLPVLERGKDMGNVLAFRPRKSSGVRAPRRGSATIIIFPGVRYERQPSADINTKWSPVNWIGHLQPRPRPTN